MLTEEDKHRMHRAILGYFEANGFEESLKAFSKESGVSESPESSDLLPKKWASIVYLQQKNNSLQSELKLLKEEIHYFKQKKLKEKKSEGIPILPPKFTLEAHTETVTHLAIHPLRNLLAACSEDSSITLWNLESSALVASLTGHSGPVYCVDFEPQSGYLLASCSADMLIKLWHMESFQCVKTIAGHEHAISSIAFLPSADFIVSGSRDKTVRLWEITRGVCVREFSEVNDWAKQVCVNEEGNYLAACVADCVLVWSVDNPDPVQRLAGHSDLVETVCFSGLHSSETIAEPSDKLHRVTSRTFLASGSRDKTIKVWEVAHGECLMQFEGHDNWVRALAFHPGGRFLYSSSDDKSVRLWDLRARQNSLKISNAHSHFAVCLVISAKHEVCASGSVDRSIKVWDLR